MCTLKRVSECGILKEWTKVHFQKSDQMGTFKTVIIECGSLKERSCVNF